MKPANEIDVYAQSAGEAIAGAMHVYRTDVDAVVVTCDLEERDVAIIRGGVDVLHADCFPQ